jgi:short-subunit dehydrogenase
MNSLDKSQTSKPDAGKKWALVTGASAGIGEEFCRQLAGLSYSLVLVARRKDRLEELAAQLRASHSIDCRCFPLDLSQESAVKSLTESLQQEGIEIEFLVNNAGYGVPGHFQLSSWKTHADSLQVMLHSVCELSWSLLPGMQARKIGYIINVASIAGLTPGSAGHTLYGAKKSFLIKFSESLAIENHDTGVAISALCPGFTYSEFHDITGTRDLVSQMPSYMWMSAKDVVQFGLRSVMQEKPLVTAIPGRFNRLVALLFRLMPRRFALRMIQRQSHRWRAAEKTAD